MKYPLASAVIFSMAAASSALAADDSGLLQGGDDSSMSQDSDQRGISGGLSGTLNRDEDGDYQGRSNVFGQAQSKNGQASMRNQTMMTMDPDAGISPEQARLNTLPGDLRDALMNRDDSQSQIESLTEDSFASFDVNGDEGIVKAEVHSNPIVLQTITAFDADGNGELSSDEFTSLRKGLSDELQARKEASEDLADGADEGTRNDFEGLDSNDDNIIAGHEVDRSSRLSNEFFDADENDDGFVSEAEFAKFTEEVDDNMDRDSDE